MTRNAREIAGEALSGIIYQDIHIQIPSDTLSSDESALMQ